MADANEKPLDSPHSDQHDSDEVEAIRRAQAAAAQVGGAAAVEGYAAGETGLSESPSGPSAGSALGGNLEDQGGDWGRGGQDPEARPRRNVGVTEAAARPVSAAERERRDWTAVLGRLGGSSPGSQENLALAEKFGNVQFPAARDDVLRRLGVEAEFHFRAGSPSIRGSSNLDIGVDLRHAVEASRMQTFRNMNDLIDCVKDELRRAEMHEVGHGTR